MNNNNLLIRYDQDLRLRMIYPDARKEITDDVVRYVRRAPGTNQVAFTFAHEGELERVIAQQLDYFVPMRQPVTWRVYAHDHLPGLGEKLVERDFLPEAAPREVLVLDVRQAPPDPLAPAPEEVRPLTTQQVLRQALGVVDNSLLRERLSLHFSVPGYLSVYAAYRHDRPDSVAWTYFPHGQFAALSAGSASNVPLLAARVREVRERGYPYALVEADPRDRPVFEAAGFRPLTTLHEYR
ncbi:MAG TPA: hypothetical protein VF653_01980, partial [Methylomirabilota bacterium]